MTQWRFAPKAPWEAGTACWRFLRWQPEWKAAQRLKLKLADGTSMRKKAVVALARQLAIDLWRWRTGRATMAELGWIAA